MRRLVLELGMLTGLSVSYGNARESDTCRIGLAREVDLMDGAFVPCERPLTGHSLYDLASLTKLFTAVSVMQLMQRGLLHLHDAVGVVDDRFAALQDTSLYDVLTYQAVLRSPERIDAQPTPEAALRQVFLTGRHLGPEPARLYSDMNALVLKYLVERVSGLAYMDYLQRHIFAPCGMGETYARVPEDRLADCLCYNYEHRLMAGQHRLLEDAYPGRPHDPKARLLAGVDGGPCGHAGLFSTQGDMVRFAQGLLRGDLLSRASLMELGRDRTGRPGNDGRPYRQYLGYLCFAKGAVQRVSEVPAWMGHHAFAVSGYTGNHLAVDPELGVFDLFLGNRCHNRVSVIDPPELADQLGLSPEYAGVLPWPDGRSVRSSFRYIHLKDALLHRPVRQALLARGWMPGPQPT